MKKSLLLAIAFLAVSHLIAQNTLTVIDTGNVTRERWRDSVLRMDKNQVPTGFLLEYSMFGFEINKYDGLGADDDTIKNDGRIFELHSILWHSKVNNNPTIDLTDTLFSKGFFAHLNTNVFPLTFIYQSYNYIRQTALSEGLFTIAGDSVGILDVPGRSQSPYNSSEIFAFAPFKTSITRFNAIPFSLPDELFYIQGFTSVEVDFDDGVGFRTLAKGSTVNIYYATEGLKYLKARLNTVNGTRIAKCMIEYKRPAYYAQPDYTWNIAVDPVYTDDNQYLGLSRQMQTLDGLIFPCGGSFIEQLLCSVRPNANVTVENGCDGVFDKPIIIVEGFDPDGKLDIEALRLRFNRNGFISTLKGYGYDFVFVDFTKNTTYIENNAKVLEAVIDQVNQTKVGNFNSSVIGFSMGGLIARWCLKDMEDRSLQHHVANYFSYDAPHQGANIPLGMQYIFREMVRDIPYLRWLSTDLGKLEDAFKSPAARQMLVTYGSYDNGPFNWFPNLNTLDPLRATFAERLLAKGYPQQTTNYGLAFGRGNNTISTKDAGNGRQFTPGSPFNPQDNIFSGELTFLLVNAEAIANAVPENNTNSTVAYYKFAGLTFRKIFGITILPVFTLRVRRFDYTGQYPYDDAPGGFELTQTQFKRSWRPGLSDPATTNGHDGHSFLPVASALDLQNQGYSSTTSWQSNNLFANIDNQIQNPGQVSGNTLSTPSLSPFTAIITGTSDCSVTGCSAEPYLSSDQNWVYPPNSNSWNHFHNTDITFQFARFIQRKIINAQPINCAGTNGLCNSNPTISGPSLLCTNGQYQLVNPPSGVSIVWEMQNNRLKIDNGQGTPLINVSKISDGTEVVKAILTNACGASLTVTLAITVGTPQPILSVAVNCPEITGYALNAPGATTYTWSLDTHSGTIVNPNETSIKGYKNISDDVTICINYTNACGTSISACEHVYCPPGGGHRIVVSPNPANSNVTVSLKDASVTGKKEAVKQPLIYEAVLSDKLGNVKKRIRYKGVSSVTIYVGDLPKDIYVLKLFDGSEWVSEKIVVL